MSSPLRASDFEYPLEAERIAQQPLERRDQSRLMRLRRRDGQITHHVFGDLGELLRPGDLLVLNDTRVIPARFACRRPSGGKIEGLFLREVQTGRWQVMLKGAGRCRTGERLALASRSGLGGELHLRLSANLGQGCWEADLLRGEQVLAQPAAEVLEQHGVTPLPPYIHRPAAEDEASGEERSKEKEPFRGKAHGRLSVGLGVQPTEEKAHGKLSVGLGVQPTEEKAHGKPSVGFGAGPGEEEETHEKRPSVGLGPAEQDRYDRTRYQTVYADRPGAVAAPTAGLHFTPELLEQLSARGMEFARVTLHVALGTFAPVKDEDLAAHPMHEEWYELPTAAADQLNAARSAGRRIVAVGTTSVRVLETAADEAGRFAPASGWTKIFLYPPATFRAVDALITNFHLPRSTLLMLVAAFCQPGRTGGLEMILRAYDQARRLRYRFYSYGDAMLIE